MRRLEKKLKLANEAVELIKEFKEKTSVSGKNSLKEVSIKNEGDVIEICDEVEGLKEYSLIEISLIFKKKMTGWGPCLVNLYEAVGTEAEDLNMNFRDYIANLKSIENRCKDIYARLKEIENEALSM